MTENKDNPTFEQTLTDLRETVQALEAGNVSLEEATRLFERGMNLAKTCNELLSSAELHVKRLQRSFGEQMSMMEHDQQQGDYNDGSTP